MPRRRLSTLLHRKAVSSERCRRAVVGLASAGVPNPKFADEDVMVERDNGRIVETAREARQGERGPSVLVLLTVSTLLAAIVLASVWFVFFMT